MAAVIKDLAQVNAGLNAELQAQKERVDTVDFKMVSFSLAGKGYGVDIMNIKEIAKADKFTYVPNTASFVRGVYNLRGDIIPIIDLRLFFHLRAEHKDDGQENMLILHIEDRVYGVIVDKIDRVIGLNSASIQPPHPIFGDINIKFISGVVEHEGDLYIILDMVRIFSQREADKAAPRAPSLEVSPVAPAEALDIAGPETDEASLGFIRDALKVIKGFNASPVNNAWVQKRFAEWSRGRSGADLQLKNIGEADEYLSAFYSPCTGAFWDDDYVGTVKSILPDMPSGSIQVWNPGCGKGYETFSFICILKERYPSAHIKVWANDNDIMAIASAPNMTFDLEDVPEYIRPYMVKGKNGYSFSQELKDAALFEYHDILNGNVLPELDIILMRDLLSFISVQNQDKMRAEFSEKLKKNGLVILGNSEELPPDEWQSVSREPVSAFVHG
ncbi:MAG: chemotaxis protein CheW [Treponema sp.]|jgi:purine-binding chemotaxis protein CheW|nr:chemotaxis protein CheW [Treponema sp.]